MLQIGSLSIGELYQLLKLLNIDRYVTANEIAGSLKVSNRTVRNKLKELNCILQENGALLEARSHYGYRIKVEKPEIFQQFQNTIYQKSDSQSEPMEIAAECIFFMLAHRDYYTIDFFCDKFYVSRTVLSKYIKLVEEGLRKYNLKIERRQKYGMRIVGDMFQRRLCMSYFLRYVPDVYSESEQMQIAQIVKKILKEYNLHMADMAFHQFLATLFVLVLETKNGYVYCELENNMVELDTEVLEIADKIRISLNQAYDIEIDETENRYLGIHLKGKQYLNYEIKWNQVISTEIMTMVQEIVAVIKTLFDIDLNGNFDFKMSLSQHLIPLCVRLKYNMQIENPILDIVKSNYSFAYNIAVHSAVVIEKRTGKKMSDDEIGYIATIIVLGLGEKTYVKKKNVMLICSSGMSGWNLLEHKIRHLYGDYIGDITIGNRYSLAGFDTSKIDYILTTVPIIEKLDKPIVEVYDLLEDGESKILRAKLKESQTESIADFFATDLFYPNMTGKTHREVIHNICERIKATRKISSDFENLVLIRENLSPTDFGKYSAMPHPIERGEESIVAVAVLEQPILWGENQVQVVFLISLAKDVGDEAQIFWEKISDILMSEEKIRKLIEEPTFERFSKLMET